MRRAHLIVALACLFASPAGADPPAPPDDGGALDFDPDSDSAAAAESERGALAETQRFVAAGGDVCARMEDKDTLLGHAAMGVTRLHDAVESGYTSVARYLLEHGADPRAVAETKSEFNDLTPIDLARLTGGAEFAELLERYHVRRFWYSPGDEDAAKLALDTDQVEDTWSDEPPPTPDLLIRPDVPEVRAAPGAAVASAGSAAYADLSAVPDGATWGQRLPSTDTRQGRVFLAKSRSGRLFKVLLARYERGRHLTISFTDLVRAAPEDRAVRDVVAEFQSAQQDGRVDAAANLCTVPLARKLRAAPAASTPRPRVRRVQTAEVVGDRATVVLFEQREPDAGRVLVTFVLVRIGPAWRIESVTSAPAPATPQELPGSDEPEDDEI